MFGSRVSFAGAANWSFKLCLLFPLIFANKDGLIFLLFSSSSLRGHCKEHYHGFYSNLFIVSKENEIVRYETCSYWLKNSSWNQTASHCLPAFIGIFRSQCTSEMLTWRFHLFYFINALCALLWALAITNLVCLWPPHNFTKVLAPVLSRH